MRRHRHTKDLNFSSTSAAPRGGHSLAACDAAHIRHKRWGPQKDVVTFRSKNESSFPTKFGGTPGLLNFQTQLMCFLRCVSVFAFSVFGMRMPRLSLSTSPSTNLQPFLTSSPCTGPEVASLKLKAHNLSNKRLVFQAIHFQVFSLADFLSPVPWIILDLSPTQDAIVENESVGIGLFIETNICFIPWQRGFREKPKLFQGLLYY